MAAEPTCGIILLEELLAAFLPLLPLLLLGVDFAFEITDLLIFVWDEIWLDTDVSGTAEGNSVDDSTSPLFTLVLIGVEVTKSFEFLKGKETVSGFFTIFETAVKEVPWHNCARTLGRGADTVLVQLTAILSEESLFIIGVSDNNGMLGAKVEGKTVSWEIVGIKLLLIGEPTGMEFEITEALFNAVVKVHGATVEAVEVVLFGAFWEMAGEDSTGKFNVLWLSFTLLVKTKVAIGVAEVRLFPLFGTPWETAGNDVVGEHNAIGELFTLVAKVQGSTVEAVDLIILVLLFEALDEILFTDETFNELFINIATTFGTSATIVHSVLSFSTNPLVTAWSVALVGSMFFVGELRDTGIFCPLVIMFCLEGNQLLFSVLIGWSSVLLKIIGSNEGTAEPTKLSVEPEEIVDDLVAMSTAEFVGLKAETEVLGGLIAEETEAHSGAIATEQTVEVSGAISKNPEETASATAFSEGVRITVVAKHSMGEPVSSTSSYTSKNESQSNTSLINRTLSVELLALLIEVLASLFSFVQLLDNLILPQATEAKLDNAYVSMLFLLGLSHFTADWTALVLLTDAWLFRLFDDFASGKETWFVPLEMLRFGLLDLISSKNWLIFSSISSAIFTVSMDSENRQRKINPY